MAVVASLVDNATLPELFRLRSQPKQKRTREAFDKILDAAIELSYEYKITSINTNLIAERAELDIATLYRIFPNKESIYYWAMDRSLAKIRLACEEMNEDKYLKLSWKDFFAQQGARISSVIEQEATCEPLMPLWRIDPEFQQLLNLHYDYLINFFVKHLKRFGAKESKAKLGHLVYYLIMTSESIRGISSSIGKIREQEFYRLNYDTWIFHISRVLD